jgi:hypothetical protein
VGGSLCLEVTQTVAGVVDSFEFRTALAAAVSHLSSDISHVEVGTATLVGADGRLTVVYTVTALPPPDALIALLASAKGVMGVMRDLQQTFPNAALAPPAVVLQESPATTTAVSDGGLDGWFGIEDMYQQKRPHELAYLQAQGQGQSAYGASADPRQDQRMPPHSKPPPPPPRYGASRVVRCSGTVVL